MTAGIPLDSSASNREAVVSHTASHTRLSSLDVFRGVTVAFMLLVNNPGSWDEIHAPLEHASWDGCTPTDLVFPFFLYIVGVSTAFSLSRAKEDQAESKKIMLKIARRGSILFLIGLFLNLFPHFNFATLRIMGVLQRIALVYVASAFLFLNLSRRQLIYTAATLLVGYYLLMVVFPLLSGGSYSLAPGKNMAAIIDRSILTNAHMWKPAKTWDPEGLTGTLPAIASGIIGLLAGLLMRDKVLGAETKVIRLFTASFFLVAAGYLWGLFFPINKSLWTSPYVLYTGGLASAFLAVLYYLIDMQGRKKGITFFLVFGMNSIAAFVLSGLVPRTMNLFPLRHETDKTPVYIPQAAYETFTQVASPKNASLLYALLNVAVYFVILGVMYRRKVFIKI